jgi:hypothetical protein
MDSAVTARPRGRQTVGKCPKCRRKARVCDGSHYLCERYSGEGDSTPEIAATLHEDFAPAAPRARRSASASWNGSGNGSGTDLFFMTGGYDEAHVIHADECRKGRAAHVKSEAKCQAKAEEAARTIAHFNLRSSMLRGNPLMCDTRNSRPRYVDKILSFCIFNLHPVG